MTEDKKYCVYTHEVETENGKMVYVGMTSMKLSKRWQPSNYKTTSMYAYIDKYGWNNIVHNVIESGLTKEEASDIEDKLICEYTDNGVCINERRSGYICKNRYYYNEKSKSYYHKRYKNDQEYTQRKLKQGREYMRRKRAENTEFIKQDRERNRQYMRERRKNDTEFAERYREYNRKKLATPEGRIYDRVKAFNRYHPDRAIETPKEARDKYLENGYIPQYIKHDDL